MTGNVYTQCDALFTRLMLKMRMFLTKNQILGPGFIKPKPRGEEI